MTETLVKVRLLDEVNVVITNLHPDHTNLFYEEYGVFAPNYFFHPKYQIGAWDGKIRYFQKTGKTYNFLLDEIIPKLHRLGYKPEIEDLRTATIIQPKPIDRHFMQHIIHLEDKAPIILNEHQLGAVNALVENGYGIVEVGTGGGKTFMCTALCMVYGSYNLKTLTIVPNKTLIRQTKAEYENAGLETGQFGDKKHDTEQQHIVSTWQSLQNNPQVLGLFDMVIVDECHGVRGNVLTELLNKHAKKLAYRFGFTGTVPKDPAERMAVLVALGPVRYQKPASELIDEGILSTLTIDVVELQEDLTAEYEQYKQEAVRFSPTGKIVTYKQFREQYLPDFPAEKAYLRNKKDRLKWIAACIEEQRDQKKGNVLCLVDTIAFGRKLAAEVQGAIFVNGKDMEKDRERQEVYDMFNTRDDLVVIATVHIAGVGVNIRRIFNLMFVDMGKSFIRVIQTIGRGLRKADDKDHVNVADISSDLKYGSKHQKERIKFYKEANYPFKVTKVDYAKSTSVDF